jgi:hypothetical protein
MKEFEGKLESIAAGKLINKEKPNDFDSFFLILGLIYNDLKDLLLFLDLFNKNYRHPEPDGSEPASVHLGQWGGIQNHLNRLFIGFISEFLIFIDKNRDITSTISFNNFLKGLPIDIKRSWFDILLVLDNKKTDDFLSQIARIRSNVSFHYDQSLTELRSGFIKKFFDSPKDKYNEKAYYSLGDTMEKTRFFYSDGAVEEYLKEHMKVSKDNYYIEIKNLVEKTNRTLRFMIEGYLKTKLINKN